MTGTVGSKGIIIGSYVTSTFLRGALLVPRRCSIVTALGLGNSCISSRLTTVINNVNVTPKTGVGCGDKRTVFRTARNATPGVTKGGIIGPYSLLLSSIVVLRCVN